MSTDPDDKAPDDKAPDMTANILFAAHPSRWPLYRDPLIRALKETGTDFDLQCEFAPEFVDYIIYTPNSPVQDFTPFTRLKAVLSLWAGVESVVGNATLSVPLARMVDHGLKQGMREWVAGHVLRHHLGMDAHVTARPGQWQPSIPPLAQERHIAVLGLGELGRTCATTLAGLGFAVTGWSRSPKQIDGIATEHGDAGLRTTLASAEILVLLLPDTPATTNILNKQTLSRMPRGAIIINPGRGTLIDDQALLAALDTGQIAQATLDVFRTEPLPAEHPYWAHPNVTVTPHIASETRPETAALVIAENIRRGERGKPFLHLADRNLGY